ncbi:MAG: hypothetical protein IPF99_26030 [Deltaproteobacteria bacterium]|nr:hypothetical protein [Deltaproteobacteria bacterium]
MVATQAQRVALPEHERSTPSQRSGCGVTSPSQLPHDEAPPDTTQRCVPAWQGPTPSVDGSPL